MHPNNELNNPDLCPDDAFKTDSPGDEDFFRELEAKEKDLDISPELVIEVEESEFDDRNIPDFLREELAATARVPSPRTISDTAVSGVQGGLPEFEAEIAGLKEKISRMETERLEILEASRRRLKDFENFKSRIERDRSESFTNQVCNLAAEMLPVLDNLNRALDSVGDLPLEQHSEIQQFFDGIVLVNQQVNEVFAGLGVQPIASVGESFDPHFHEAVATEETTELPHNTISQELLRGYRLGNRVIRHSMVKVATSAGNGNNPATSERADEPEFSFDAPDLTHE